MKILLGAMAFAAFAAASPAHAVIFQYFEGNNCTQKRLGASDVGELANWNMDSNSWNLKAKQATERSVIIFFAPFLNPFTPKTFNDEIRSVLVLSNWRTVREARNPTFTVYDSPEGRTNDDWARIHVTDASLIPEEGVCVGTFEKAFNKYGVRLERHPVNGLDGKISHLEVSCDAACRTNLTPDQTPVGTTQQPLGSSKKILKKIPLDLTRPVTRRRLPEK